MRSRSRTVLLLDADPPDPSGPAGLHEEAAPVRARWVRDAAGAAPDTVDGVLADGCPWPSVRNGEPVILVIRDAALDIERLASQGFAATALGAWQRHRLLRERRRERTPGTLVWLGRHACPDARAAVQRETLDPGWIERLEPLVRDGLTIAGVALPERLLAAAHGRRAVPRFTALLETRHVRHVLVIDGVACFSRRVASSDDPGTVAGDIVASLAHALDRWSLTRVALDASDLPVAVASALDALVDGVPVLVEPWSVDAAPPPGQALIRLAAGPAGHGREPASLAPLGRAWRERRTRHRLGLFCAAGCVLALGVAVHAAAVGPGSVARAGLLDAQRDAVLSSLRTVRADTSTLHAQPERAARFVVAFERLGASSSTSPDSLLVGIARALTRHEGLTLDALTWSHRSLDEGEDRDEPPFDGAVFTGAADLPFARAGTAIRLSVELDGRVTGAIALRDAQALVHAFVDDVRTVAALHDCRIMASPLSAAARGEVLPGARSQEAATAAPVWRVRCNSVEPAS